MQQRVQEQQKMAQLATWEARTDQRIKAVNMNRRLKALQDRREADLDRRRQDLACKLAAEQQALQAELLSSRRTPEQRRAELAERARSLAARREGERQRLAQQLLDQQFKEGCDQLRGVESKKLTMDMIHQQQLQAAAKAQEHLRQHDIDMRWAAINLQQGAEQERKYQAEKRAAQERYKAIGALLDEQCAANAEQHAEEAAQVAQEVQALKAQWAAEDEAARQEEVKARLGQQRLNVEVKEFNRVKQAEMQAVADAERAADVQLVSDAMRSAAEEEAREQAAKEQRKEEQRRYRATSGTLGSIILTLLRSSAMKSSGATAAIAWGEGKHLELLLEREQVSTAERDAMIEAAWEEQSARQEAEQAARDAARKRLMDEVTAAQVEQMRQHQLARRRGADNEAIRAEQALQLAAEDQAAEAARLREYRNELRHRMDIEAQMVAKQQRRAAEQTQKREEVEAHRQAEAAYQQRISTLLEKAEPRQYYGRRKVDWFT
eukprot:jgi/Astpho2/1355/Aster-x1001